MSATAEQRSLVGQVQIIFQKLSLAWDLFHKHEMLNHAGAAAFFFMLSMTPFFLLLVFAFDRYLMAVPEVSANLFTFLETVHPELNRELLVKMGLLHGKTAAMGAFGVLNLFWAGGCILTAMQRALALIFPSDKKRSSLVINIISFVTLSCLVLLSTLIMFIVMGLNYFRAAAVEHPMAFALFHSLKPIVSSVVPPVTILTAVFIAYRYLPPQKPKTASSLVGALWCAIAIIFLHVFFASFFVVARYSLIYGVLGSVILMVLLVYFSFVFFYFFAEYTFVSDKIDVYLLGRLYYFRSDQDIRGRRIAKFLFTHPRRLFEKYAAYYGPNEALFHEGDSGRDIYYVYRGAIGIYRRTADGEQRIAMIEAGEIFGEMAYLLGEVRMATARAQGEAVLIKIPPDVFEQLLETNIYFTRELLRVLTNRLRKVQIPDIPDFTV
jgi:membrane protein